jgi:hypothetical protein
LIFIYFIFLIDFFSSILSLIIWFHLIFISNLVFILLIFFIFLIKFCFQFYPLAFDFKLFLYLIYSPYFYCYFFLSFFIVFCFQFHPLFFCWFRILLYYFLGFAFYGVEHEFQRLKQVDFGLFLGSFQNWLFFKFFL